MGVFNLRLDDETHEKIRFIADQQSRSQNKQVEFIIKQFISEFERVNGKIGNETCETVKAKKR